MDDILNQILKTSALRGSDAMNLARRWYHRTQLSGALESCQRVLKHMNHPVNRVRYGLRRRLPHIECPVLVIWGLKMM